MDRVTEMAKEVCKTHHVYTYQSVSQEQLDIQKAPRTDAKKKLWGEKVDRLGNKVISFGRDFVLSQAADLQHHVAVANGERLPDAPTAAGSKKGAQSKKGRKVTGGGQGKARSNSGERCHDSMAAPVAHGDEQQGVAAANDAGNDSAIDTASAEQDAAQPSDVASVDYDAAVRAPGRSGVEVQPSAALYMCYLPPNGRPKVFHSPHFGRDPFAAERVVQALISQRDCFDSERHAQFVEHGTLSAMTQDAPLAIAPLSEVTGIATSKIALLRKDLIEALDKAIVEANKAHDGRTDLVDAVKRAGTIMPSSASSREECMSVMQLHACIDCRMMSCKPQSRTSQLLRVHFSTFHRECQRALWHSQSSHSHVVQLKSRSTPGWPSCWPSTGRGSKRQQPSKWTLMVNDFQPT